ncbi:hypothetical protein CHS0354_035826 [Potamilus streckersoni]|uniref:Major facilitator superfamily (MFS) profile domain-containing protein n=1 Tax=Potamilus streckersoni TaxID=2493646 RepID=A0AAE0SWP3_9BIVA|nr:hypothetical protein CHS0354_035826 [Potamilus streckersoni]
MDSANSHRQYHTGKEKDTDDKNIQYKRRRTYIILGLFFFMGGMEYAVILPSLWLYLSGKFGAEEYFLGMVLSAFSFSAMIAGPILGRWSDVSRRPKIILLFGIVCEVGGNFMYFIGISKWFLVCSRLVTGISGGAEAVIVAEVARSTTEEKRTGIISVLIAVRQTGLLIGPGLNLFLRVLDFDLGPFKVNKLNSPGIFMSLMWTLQFVIVLTLYTDLHKLESHVESKDSDINDLLQVQASSKSDVEKYDQITNSSTLNENDEDNEEVISDKLIESAEKLMENNQKRLHQDGEIESQTNRHTIGDFNEETRVNSYGRTRYSSIEDRNEEVDHRIDESKNYGSEICKHRKETRKDYLEGRSKCRFFYDEYMREEIITVIATQFNSFFNQVALETMVTPLTKSLLDWGELENSLMYCFCGLLVIIVFFLVRCLSKRIQDRTLLVVGNALLATATAWLLFAVPSCPPNEFGENFPKFAVGTVLDIVALPFLVASGVSLYSKITRKETQGLSQGFRRTVVGMATILAPLWAGSTLPWPYVMFGVMLGLLCISLLMLALSFSKLKTGTQSNNGNSQTQSINVENQSCDKDDERKPLLA